MWPAICELARAHESLQTLIKDSWQGVRSSADLRVELADLGLAQLPARDLGKFLDDEEDRVCGQDQVSQGVADASQPST